MDRAKKSALSSINVGPGTYERPIPAGAFSQQGSSGRYALLDRNDDHTDDEPDAPNHDFGDGVSNIYGSKAVRTGRQRKKLAARSRGGEFQSKRRKRRVYFCCVSSEIDVQRLLDHLNDADDLLFGWQLELHNDVLHLYKPGIDEPFPQRIIPVSADKMADVQELSSSPVVKNSILADQSAPKVDGDGKGVNSGSARLVAVGSKEVFVFDFGAIVFWGFGRGEEAGMLRTIKLFVTKGAVRPQEFQSGEDDMAFVTSPDEKEIGIANDVITLPDDTLPKQRMAVSFAIAQSSVLAIFEARIEHKVDEYKYIPEALAAHGKVSLSERQLGMMIGDVFVIRHDVNLHTEILDTPDFFWKEKIFESDYKMVSSYLEMTGRTEILNKRLDMLRELLDVLQQQMENAHAVKLEWIVIYLIVAEVLLQSLTIVSKFF